MPDKIGRYRAEDGRLCIDIRLKSSRQLFDGRDPAPFRERDIDGHAVGYLVGAVQEIPDLAEVKLVFWISDEPVPRLPDATLVEAVRAHFRYEVANLDLQIRQHLRRAQIFLLVGRSVLPCVYERRIRRRLRAAPMEVRHGAESESGERRERAT